jgi:nucleotide-binding universal stress UspA family protein
MSDERLNKGLRKILVATDFSEGSDEALVHAVAFARQAGAAVEIVHVLDFTLLEFPIGLGDTEAEQGGYAGLANTALDERCERLRGAGIACQFRLLEGAPAAEIVRRAQDTRADLIVVGTHGRTGVVHALLGSIAERVVRHASCPVLTVPLARKAA